MWSAMDHAKVAGEVVEAVGGASNISAAAHCATRLRLVIADESKINQQALDDNEDLKGTFAARRHVPDHRRSRRC